MLYILKVIKYFLWLTDVTRMISYAMETISLLLWYIHMNTVVVFHNPFSLHYCSKFSAIFEPWNHFAFPRIHIQIIVDYREIQLNTKYVII